MSVGIRQAAELLANTIRARQVDPSGTCYNQTPSHRASGTEIGADVVLDRDPAQKGIIRTDSGKHMCMYTHPPLHTHLQNTGHTDAIYRLSARFKNLLEIHITIQMH